MIDEIIAVVLVAAVIAAAFWARNKTENKGDN